MTAAKQTVYEATVVEQQLEIVADARDSAIAAVERAERTFEHATVRTALEQLIERETAVTRAAGQLGVAQQSGRTRAVAFKPPRRGLPTQRPVATNAWQSRARTRSRRSSQKSCSSRRSTHSSLSRRYALKSRRSRKRLRRRGGCVNVLRARVRTRRASISASRPVSCPRANKSPRGGHSKRS